MSEKKHEDVSIVLAGAAGQGIKTVETVLTKVASLSGLNVFSTKEYMSRIRGGINSTEIRISKDNPRAFVDRIDVLIPLDDDSKNHLEKRITKNTIIISEDEIAFTKIAEDIGDKIYANMVAVGAIIGLLGLDIKHLDKFIKKKFAKKGEKVITENIQAGNAGFQEGIKIGVKPDRDFGKIKASKKQHLLLNGAQAVSLGALSGGCNFISAYPMSPSTGVLTFLSQHEHDFDIIAEQAEDEISAINMALGASYAGATAMTSTSGGGFALMCEGVSLAGMIETPLVIHIAQRPGPATGLPTRTAQEDLELALYSGHGEFPRIILAPGTIEEAITLTKKAFELADKIQIPVFILTDQYLIDTYYNIDFPNLEPTVKKSIIKTRREYQRYELTDSGISPRGIPGYGEGLVCVDSDEHDESGHITEHMDVRNQMVEKRLKKYDKILEESIQPEIIGSSDFSNLILCWGSTRNTVEEAINRIGDESIGALHFKQVYPIPEKAVTQLYSADKVIAIENNVTGQFTKLLKTYSGFEVDDVILKYDGLPFSVEETIEKIKGAMSE